MDVQSNFEYLCRVCAANTKSKNSVAECVYILKSPALKDKIERYLYLKIADDDPLPKVLCKTCFRQVEATASLSNIAKHTQQVFRDFLNSSLPRHKQVTGNNININSNLQSSTENDEFRPLVLTKAPETTITLAPPQPPPPVRDEVIISLTKKDGETRPRTKTTAINQRRSSTFDYRNRYTTPVSIAHRSMIPSTLPAVEAVHAPAKQISITAKSACPAGVISFIQTHGKITGSANSSGSNVFSMPNSIIQQKRKNLKMALNNIKAVNSGQVSLLKTSQLRQKPEMSIETSALNQNKKVLQEPAMEECLPENIIIAAPKQKKKEEHMTITNLQTPLEQSTQSKETSLEQSSAQFDPPENSLTEGILLGSVIRDPDLLKLILKALKWTVTKGNSEEQMNKLKNSKFAEIMSDTNLLQDTDLTQLLGPYIAPVLLAAQALQKQGHQPSKLPPKKSKEVSKAEISIPKVTEKHATTDIASAISYKLPPETSVQLVPSSPPTEPDSCADQSTSLLPNLPEHRNITAPRQQRKPQHCEEPVISERSFDLENNRCLKSNTALLSLDALLMSQYGSQVKLTDNTSHGYNDLMKKPHKSTNQLRRSRSSSVQPKSPSNLEDIVLVEPQPSLLKTSELTLIADAATSVSVLKDIEPRQALFKIPSKDSTMPLITRPIIKRRKTVIQSLKTASSNATLEIAKKSDSTDNICTTKNPSELQVESHQIDSPQLTLTTTQEHLTTAEEHPPSNNNSTEKEIKKIEVATSSKPVVPKKSNSSKSALGQQLLEAIGLQNVTRGGSTEGIAVSEYSRDTLRSALKRSLKQAQEQQLLKRVKQEEPVKQQADSTTKSGVRDSFDEDKQHKTQKEQVILKCSRNSSCIIDESHIHKINYGEVSQTMFESQQMKEEKAEQLNVSSSDMSIRKRGRKRKEDKDETKNNDDEFAVDEKDIERWDDDDDLPLKQEGVRISSRPTRTSKTMSKYYKGPVKTCSKSHSMGTRASRHR